MTRDKDVIGAYKPGKNTFSFQPVGKAMSKPAATAKKAMTPKAKKK
jgi:hypothetical protein